MTTLRKLVRDGIPDIIRAGGETPVTHIATPGEYRRALRAKLREEMAEYFESGDIDELADILEVVYALGRLDGCDPAQLDAVRERKAAHRGTFSGRVMLDDVERKRGT